ncbi:MAG: ComF family protein [Burkholderiales bacterium]|nr:ComF family protein [Anaerolineae bacterium]
MPNGSILTHQNNNIEPQEAQARTEPFASRTKLRKLFALGVDLLFPPRCAGCGRVDTDWCSRCQREIDHTPYIIDVIALEPLAALAATGAHIGKLRQAVHALKYENTPKLAVPLGERLAAHLTLLEWPIDTVISVPLHTSRRQQRGYNQSHLLSEIVASIVDKPCWPDAIERQRDTRPQVGLNRQQRQANMANAFTAHSHIGGHTALLIDDVYTTGATLSGCAAALLSAGASAVYGLTVTAAND